VGDWQRTKQNSQNQQWWPAAVGDWERT
jgi:hypothetical protein